MNHGDACPFDLSHIDFKIFSEYLATKKKQQHQGNRHTQNWSNTLSRATYDGCQSALMHLYRICGVQVDKKFAKELSVFMGAIKRMVRNVVVILFIFTPSNMNVID